MKRTLPYFFFILTLLGLDQVTKLFLVKQIPYGGSKNIIPGFLNLSHVHNRGAIFGFFNQAGTPLVYLILTLASLTALGLVVYYFIKVPFSERLLKITLSLVLAGALGNLADRLLRGYVIDFIDIYIGKYHWPSFNVADSCISIGAVLLIYIFFFKKGEKCSLYSSN